MATMSLLLSLPPVNEWMYWRILSMLIRLFVPKLVSVLVIPSRGKLSVAGGQEGSGVAVV